MASRTEAQWQAENDARTIARADAIKADPQRLQAAKGAAARIVGEETAEANSLRRLAGQSAPPPGQAPMPTRRSTPTSQRRGRPA